MGYKLEQSATKPSRKSTRKGIHKKKSGSKLARRQAAKVRSPKARRDACPGPTPARVAKPR